MRPKSDPNTLAAWLNCPLTRRRVFHVGIFTFDLA